MSETWRVFCAIDLPPDLKQKLADQVSRLRQAFDVKASWTRADNVHLTIKFLGDVPVANSEKLSHAAARATQSLSPFRLTAEQCGVFPTHGPPRVLWIGITDPGGKLAQLHAQLEEECAIAGFPKEARPFHPHLTIARLRHSMNARSLGAAHRALDFEPAEIAVSELLVIRSELGKHGSTYSVISRHPLREK
jgi:2'-5' RNA ligase